MVHGFSLERCAVGASSAAGNQAARSPRLGNSGAKLTTWHLITGEYPPQPGGVSDYTRLVAIELARAGDLVNVWAPGTVASESVEEGTIVHRLPGHFGPKALRVLDSALRATPGRILVQY